MRVIADTSPLFSLANPREGRHLDARLFRRTPSLELFLTEPVLEELFTLGRRRIGFRNSWTLASSFRDGMAGTVVTQSDEAVNQTWSVLREYSGVPLSYADASIVVLARQMRVTEVFSFDDDLRQVGLRLVP